MFRNLGRQDRASLLPRTGAPEGVIKDGKRGGMMLTTRYDEDGNPQGWALVFIPDGTYVAGRKITD